MRFCSIHYIADCLVSIAVIVTIICRFTVRDFVYDEAELQAGKNEIIKLSTDKKKQFVSNPHNGRSL